MEEGAEQGEAPPPPPVPRRQYCDSLTRVPGRLDIIMIQNYNGLPDITIVLGPDFTTVTVDRNDAPRYVMILETAAHGRPALSVDFRPRPAGCPLVTFIGTDVCGGCENGRHEYRYAFRCFTSRDTGVHFQKTNADGVFVDIGKCEYDMRSRCTGLWTCDFTSFERYFYITDGERYTRMVKSQQLPNDLLKSVESLQTQKNLRAVDIEAFEADFSVALASFDIDLRELFKIMLLLRGFDCRYKIGDIEAARRQVTWLKEILASLSRVSVVRAANEPNDGVDTTHEGPGTQDHQRLLRLRELLQQLRPLEEEAMQANYDDVDRQIRDVDEELTRLFNQLREFRAGTLQEIGRLLRANGGEISNALLQFFARLDATEFADLRAPLEERARERDRLNSIAELAGQIRQLRREISDAQNRESGLLARLMELENQARGTQPIRGATTVQTPESRPQLRQDVIERYYLDPGSMDKAETRLRTRREAYHNKYRAMSGSDPGEIPSRDELQVLLRNNETGLRQWLNRNRQDGWPQFEQRWEKYLRDMEEVQLYEADINRENEASNQRLDRAIPQLENKVREFSASFGLNDASIEVDQDHHTVSVNPGNSATGARDPDLLGQMVFGIGLMSIHSVSQPHMAFVMSAPRRRMDDVTWAIFRRQVGLALQQSQRQGLLFVYEPIPDDASPT